MDKKLDSVAKRFDEFLDLVIQEHMDRADQKEEDEKDFVDVLLDVQKEDSLGFRLDIAIINGVLLDMYIAATDTTSTVVEWAMAELIKHPRVMSKLQNELRGMKKAGEDILTEDDLVDMHYLKAVIKETLRLHPPLPLLFPKLALQDVEIDGYKIKANTQVVVNAWHIARDPKSFNKPEEFKPERFLNVNRGVSYKGTDFRFIPFGAGKRVCPAIQFASVINGIALANLVQKFAWTLPAGERIDDLNMKEAGGLTIQREDPLKVFALPYSFA